MSGHRGLLVVPDVNANTGGVICAAMECRGATPIDMALSNSSHGLRPA